MAAPARARHAPLCGDPCTYVAHLCATMSVPDARARTRAPLPSPSPVLCLHRRETALCLHRRERSVAHVDRRLVFLAHESRLELDARQHVAREEQRGGDLALVERGVGVARRDSLLLLERDGGALEEEPR